MIKSITILLIFVTMKKVGNNPHSLPFSKSLKVQKLQNSFDQNEKKLFVNGLYGSSKSFFIKEFFRINKKSIFWILNDKETVTNCIQLNPPPWLGDLVNTWSYSFTRSW